VVKEIIERAQKEIIEKAQLFFKQVVDKEDHQHPAFASTGWVFLCKRDETKASNSKLIFREGYETGFSAALVFLEQSRED